MIDKDTLKKLMEVAKSIGYGKVPPYQHNELLTSGAFDLVLLKPSDEGQLFELITSICAEYDTVKKDDKYLDGFIYLLVCAAKASDTTQMPLGMEKIIKENPDKTKELREWYRYKG